MNVLRPSKELNFALAKIFHKIITDNEFAKGTDRICGADKLMARAFTVAEKKLRINRNDIATYVLFRGFSNLAYRYEVHLDNEKKKEMATKEIEKFEKEIEMVEKHKYSLEELKEKTKELKKELKENDSNKRNVRTVSK